ncbi:hypothetical protein PISMIDRAFT_102904 [Pisolithus microcarpus 441]|uniref:2OGFeDO JBP1/TET oxygenase domain-containing protein n=1 Tax=Pisolithus microcarpus 441 TaxID=765257 RepID=A0A0C9Z7Z8_9AGAM|nr:hypothetical protein PISMIDRAFT_102904 [Pisolithus microcarpus 441]
MHDIVASLEYDEITDPTVLLDGDGNIKLWYLPGAIDPMHQKNVWDSLNLLRAPLEESIKKLCNHGWRNDWLLFHETTDLVGSIDLSPGWYQQGHGPPDFHPKVSRLLKSGREHNGMQQWVNEMSEFHVLLSGTLAIIHPWMYAAGWEALIRLNMEVKQWEDVDMSSILPSWNSIYNSMSIMVNHATPYHMDINRQELWLDMLVTVGDYPPLGFVMPTLNLWFHYNPGTVIAMSGSALEHRVGHTNSNHACLAYYMHHNVHQSVSVQLCLLPNLTDLEPLINVNS